MKKIFAFKKCTQLLIKVNNWLIKINNWLIKVNNWLQVEIKLNLFGKKFLSLQVLPIKIKICQLVPNILMIQTAL